MKMKRNMRPVMYMNDMYDLLTTEIITFIDSSDLSKRMILTTLIVLKRRKVLRAFTLEFYPPVKTGYKSSKIDTWTMKPSK
jgi:hypothetical protein